MFQPDLANAGIPRRLLRMVNSSHGVVILVSHHFFENDFLQEDVWGMQQTQTTQNSKIPNW
jgi:hypothetical protein